MLDERDSPPGSVGCTQHLSVVFFVLMACSSPAPRVIEVTACDEVAFASDSSWHLDDDNLFTLEDASGVRFRAPAVARSTTLVLTSDDGERVEVVVHPNDAAEPGLGLAPGCGAFPHGVASGDPTDTSVLLWTDYTGGDELAVEIATSPRFDTFTTDAVVELPHVALGLIPDTVYYYRFIGGAGVSRTGRTRTAPRTSTRARFALVSCSSLFSGYFNAYRRISEAELDAVIHLGDYVYDTVDPQEEVRVPSPRPVRPDSLEQWRERHRLYLRDPDLRAARAAHPWIVIWDDHDLAGDATSAIRAFREYVPMRDTGASQRAYRAISWGSLAQLVLLDVTLLRDESAEPPEILGADQMAWLEGVVAESSSRWQLVGTQKLISPLLGVGDLADDSWNGFPESRTQVMDLLEPLENVLFVSGDLHFTVFGEIPSPVYDSSSGVGAIRAEVLGPSLTRGNLDESVPNERLRDGLTRSYAEANEHFVHADLVRHGYVELDVDANRVRARAMYSAVDTPDSDEDGGPVHVLELNARHWRR